MQNSMIEDPFLILSWAAESPIFEPSDPEDFLYETSGYIHAMNEDDKRLLVGKFRIYYVDADRAMNERMSLHSVLDTYSHTFEYFDILYGKNSPYFSGRIEKLFRHEVYGSNVLILDRIELLPKWRGHGLGLKVLQHIMKRFASGAGLIAIKPFPLQFEPDSSHDDWRARLKLEDFPRNERLATKKLADYYSKLGFYRIPRTPFMVSNTA